MHTRVPTPPSLYSGVRLSHRPLRYLRDFPSPIATASQLLTYLWCSRIHLRNHNLPRAKDDPASEVKKSEFTYNTNGPFGKNYGYLIYFQTRNFGEAYWGKFISRTWRIAKSQAKATKDATTMYMLEVEGLREEERAWKTVNVLEEMKRNLRIQTEDKKDFVIMGNLEGFMNPTCPEDHHFDARPMPETGIIGTDVAEKSNESEILLETYYGFGLPSESLADTDENALPSWAADLLDTDSISAGSAYRITHSLELYEHTIPIQFSLARETYDARVACFLTRKPDLASLKTLKTLRFRPFDFYFRAALIRHMGNASHVIKTAKKQDGQKAAGNENHKNGTPKRIKWIQLVGEQKKKVPSSGRLRGYDGGVIWRLKMPGQQSEDSMYLKEKSREEIENVISSWESYEESRLGVDRSRGHDWIADVLKKSNIGKETPEKDKPIDLGPGQQRILDTLFQRPVDKAMKRTVKKEVGIAERVARKREKQWDIAANADWISRVGSTVFSSTSLLHANKNPAGNIKAAATDAEEQSFQSLLASKTRKASPPLPSSAAQYQHPHPHHHHHQQQPHTTNFTPKSIHLHSKSVPSSPHSDTYSKHKQSHHPEDDWAIKTGLFKSPDDYLWGQIDTRIHPMKPNWNSKYTNSPIGDHNRGKHWERNREPPHAEQEEGGKIESANLSSKLTILEKQLASVREEIQQMTMNPWWLRYSQPQVGPDSVIPRGGSKPAVVGFTNLEGLKARWRWSRMKIKRLKKRMRKWWTEEKKREKELRKQKKQQQQKPRLRRRPLRKQRQQRQRLKFVKTRFSGGGMSVRAYAGASTNADVSSRRR